MVTAHIRDLSRLFPKMNLAWGKWSQESPRKEKLHSGISRVSLAMAEWRNNYGGRSSGGCKNGLGINLGTQTDGGSRREKAFMIHRSSSLGWLDDL